MHQQPTTPDRQISIQRNHQSCGSVYLVTLITVAAIASMVLVGVKIRSSNNTQSTLVSDISKTTNSTHDAAEFVLESISTNNLWGIKAQSGVAFDPFTLNGIDYAASVVDAETAALPTNQTTKYRLTLSGTTENTSSKAQFDINFASVDYIALLESYQGRFYWPLNESSGDTAAEELIFNRDGTYKDPSVAGADYNDEGGQVPVFTDSNDHVEIPWATQFAEANGSFSMWIKSTEELNFTTYGIIGNRYTATGSPNLTLSIFNGALYAFISDDGTNSYSDYAISASKLFSINEWHHLTLTWGAEGLTVYLDGVQAAQNTGNTSGFGTGSKRNGGQQPITIGATNVKVLGTVTEIGYKGSIAHVAYYWGKQLSADEVAEIAAVKPDLDGISIIDNTWTIVYE